MKPPSQAQSSPLRSLVFEGVYNNARMLHFLTAVVGSTCDVRVKNGTVYEGIFKTLSSQCELAVDAVHKRNNGDGGGGGGEEGGGGNQLSLPKIEDITDTMIFSPAELVTMTCRDVDLNFAVRDTFTDSAISSSRVNGEHREKVLQRWDGDGNGENFELESDTSNGWDANEMFKFNEETYGIKSTYDSSLSMYTMPLERGNSDVYRQREARATRLAGEIESSRRVSLENDEGKSEEDKYSSVVREREGRSSPGFSSREGKYIPLPQRAREIGLSAGSMRSGSSARSSAQTTSRHPPPSSSYPKPVSDRSSPLSVRTSFSPHQTQSSPPAASSPPCTNHVLPQSLSHPQALADAASVNGGMENHIYHGDKFKCKPASTPTPPRPTPPTPSMVLPSPGQPGGPAIFSSPPGHYLSYVSPIPIQGHSIQFITVPGETGNSCSAVSGPVVGPRLEHHTSPASPMISAAASAAGPPLVASPYPQSYLQYGQVIQAMPPHYHGQPVYSVLQGGARMLTSGYPGQAEGPPGPQQAMYAPQSFSHHSGSIHHPQPSSTPTGNQPPPQHTAPSPGHTQVGAGGPQPQSMFHTGGLSAHTPPNLSAGHSSPQTAYTMQGYGLHTHQPLPHGFPSISQLTQAHVTAGLSGPHHSGGHGPPPVMLHYAPPQQGSGSNPQHGPPPQQGAPQHFYIGPPQGKTHWTESLLSLLTKAEIQKSKTVLRENMCPAHR
uniref:LsmAD domain-containing protein n=1 Tax=Anabas testudineus TaxID=64144 RepID=A0A3Q1J5D3_ANATE